MPCRRRDEEGGWAAQICGRRALASDSARFLSSLYRRMSSLSLLMSFSSSCGNTKDRSVAATAARARRRKGTPLRRVTWVSVERDWTQTQTRLLVTPRGVELGFHFVVLPLEVLAGLLLPAGAARRVGGGGGDQDFPRACKGRELPGWVCRALVSRGQSTVVGSAGEKRGPVRSGSGFRSSARA